MGGAAVAVMVRKARRDIVDHFVSADATALDRAVAFDPDATGARHRLVRRRLFRRMLNHGALRETTPGHYYLDRGQLASFIASMRMRALGIVALAGAAVAAVVALG